LVEAFLKRWGTKRDNRMLLIQFNQMKKENETLKEFDARFDNLLRKIPKELAPTEATVLLLYINAFEG
jgi:hypothetical protein